MSNFNGHGIDLVALGIKIGEISNENSRQTEIILSHINRSDMLHRELMKTLDRLPDRLADRMPAKGGLDFRMFLMILQAIPPILFVVLIAGARLSGILNWQEALKYAGSAFGGG